MKPINTLHAAFFVATFLSAPSPAQDTTLLDPESRPRSFSVGTSEIAVFMPQILEWTDYHHLKANAAIGVKLDGSTEASFGAVSIETDTAADFEHRVVRFGQRTIGPFRFPELDEPQGRRAGEIARSVFTPDAPLELPLDAMLAAVDRADAVTGNTKINLDPPPIFYSDTPAILVIFIGDPKLEMVIDNDPSLMFAVNTNWDVLFDAASSGYYLLDENQ